MSFSAVKNISISNDLTVYDSKQSTVEKIYRNMPAGAMHKLSVVDYVEDVEKNNSGDSNNNNQEDKEIIEQKYIEPYNFSQKKENNDYVTDKKQSGYLKRQTDAAVNGSGVKDYFWVEDFKNWCTWMCLANEQNADTPMVNSYVLCVWNGIDSFVPINHNGAVLYRKDEYFQNTQNQVLSNLRHYAVLKNENQLEVIDNYISQYRGDFRKFDNIQFNDEMPGLLSSVYVLKSTTKYSIYDESFQCYRYGNPMNIDMKQPGNTTKIVRYVKNLYFDRASVENETGKSLEEFEKEFNDGVKSLNKINEPTSYFYKLGENRGNWDKYRTDRCYMKIFYDPNYHDVISYIDILQRYFSMGYYYGLRLNPGGKDVNKHGTDSNRIYVELKTSDNVGKYVALFARNINELMAHRAGKNEEEYRAEAQTGGNTISYIIAMNDAKYRENIHNKDEEDYAKILFTKHGDVSNASYFNIAAIGLPCVYRLPTGELGINVNMVIGGSTGVVGYDCAFLNSKCKKIFGDGIQKTIEKNWLKDTVINNNEEVAGRVKKLSEASLDSSKYFQTAVEEDNNINISFSANNVILTTNNIESDDYVAKW